MRQNIFFLAARKFYLKRKILSNWKQKSCDKKIKNSCGKKKIVLYQENFLLASEIIPVSEHFLPLSS